MWELPVIDNLVVKPLIFITIISSNIFFQKLPEIEILWHREHV